MCLKLECSNSHTSSAVLKQVKQVKDTGRRCTNLSACVFNLAVPAAAGGVNKWGGQACKKRGPVLSACLCVLPGLHQEGQGVSVRGGGGGGERSARHLRLCSTWQCWQGGTSGGWGGSLKAGVCVLQQQYASVCVRLLVAEHLFCWSPSPWHRTMALIWRGSSAFKRSLFWLPISMPLSDARALDSSKHSCAIWLDL